MSGYRVVGEGPFGGEGARAADGAWFDLTSARELPLKRIEAWNQVKHDRLIPIHGITGEERASPQLGAFETPDPAHQPIENEQAPRRRLDQDLDLSDLEATWRS